MQKKLICLKFFICGIIVSLPYVFPKLWMLAYVTLIPVIYMLTEHMEGFTKRRAYLVGFCFGAGYFGVMFHWFTEFYPMEFADITKSTAALLVAVCWIGLASVQALEFGGVTLIYRLIKPSKERPLVCGLLFTALWVIFEWQQNFFWRGVPWARLAVTQTDAPLALQSASLLGSLFISGLIVAINALFTVSVRYALKKLNGTDIRAIAGALKNKKSAICASVALGLFMVNLIFGAMRVAVYDKTSDTPIKAAVIQGNISSLDKWGATAMQSLNKYLELTEACVKETEADLIVWPETVIPITISSYPAVMTRIAQKADELNVTLFVGAFDKSQEYNEDGERDEYNAIYLFYPDGTVSEQRYYKQRLVPFGEYTPMEKLVLTLLPVLDTFNIFNDPLTAGEGSQLFDTDHGRIGSLICFDSIYESLATQSVKDGATLLTLSTNDSWFSDSAAVYQHNSHGKLRAIETGRYIVRAASTGVSSVFSPTGEVLTEIEPLTEGYAAATIYALESRTVYSYIGNIFVYICIGYVTCIAAFKITVYVKKKKVK